MIRKTLMAIALPIILPVSGYSQISPSADLAGEASTPWSIFNNSSSVNALLIKGKELWAATTGGVDPDLLPSREEQQTGGSDIISSLPRWGERKVGNNCFHPR